MKKALKIFLYFILTIFVLILLLIVIAKLAENKIAHLVTDKIEEEIKAPVNVDEVSFSLLRQFPYASIKISGLYLGANDSVAKLHPEVPADTILYLGNTYLKVKTKALFDNKIEVLGVKIEDVDIKYDIYNDGTTNIDFLIPSKTDTTKVAEDTVASEPINALLKKLELRNVNVHYTDDSTDTRAFVHIPEIITSGQMMGEQITGLAKGSMELSDLNYPETNLSKMNKTRLTFDIGYKHDTVTIKNLKINTDGVYINLRGKAFVGDEIYTDMNIDSAVFDSRRAE
ncbi:MAG: AsmA family protein [Chloroflexia bacterium]|nr:AsmA family protein [Chloroflexia bacterium]